MLLKVLPGVAFALSMLSPAWAIEPFVVKDIRVEGLQRTEAGTVFSYLPIKVKDTVDDAKASAAIKALYATGFYSDVRIEAENDVLIVTIQERPAIASVEINGAKEFPKDQLKDGLKQVGLSEAKTYDKSLLDRAEKELKRQYVSRGRYSVDVATTVTPLERNRVALVFNIEEGEVSQIRNINIIGNQAVSESELLGLFTLRTPGLFTWFSKNDQYSKQKLSADLENLKSYYLNRGYLEFNIDSTNVSITPDKESVFITINLTEGPVYSISDVKLAGDLKVPEEELKRLISIKSGDVFSRERFTETSKRISDRLADEGYSFANVNPIPELDKEKRTAAFTFNVDPGKRVYVRRINITGNSRTRDEVVRRELRQMEGSVFSSEKIKRSKERVDRLGFFSEVNVETPAVPATSDQVDLNVEVKEKSTGSLLFGAGFSQVEKLTINASVSENNIFGSGNSLTAQVNSGRINRTLVLSYTNPYVNEDGLGRGFDIYQRNLDVSTLSTGAYKTVTRGGGVRFTIPVTETDSVSLGNAYERTELSIFSTSPQQYRAFAEKFGEKYDTWRADLGWARDTRDSIIYPTRGRLQRLYGDIGLPGGDLTYYRANYQQQWLTPLYGDIALSLNGEVGYAKGYRGKDLPFFKNFYAGGVGSIRGYQTSSLGPRGSLTDPRTGLPLSNTDGLGESVGGNRRFIGNLEILFPMPGVKDKSVRPSIFIDGGNVFGPEQKISTSDFRYSVGAAMSWLSPVGPLKFSLARPLKKQLGDREERFQFQLGTVF
ncbi:MAG: outer membrane protein assembly factor BamA [Pseudomonadota bacterium]|jgi:outer membrane protein insertion porin family